MQQRRHQVTYDKDGQIGWSIVGAMVKQFFLAGRTGVIDLKIALQQRATAAIRTFPAKSAKHRLFGQAILRGLRGELGCILQVVAVFYHGPVMRFSGAN